MTSQVPLLLSAEPVGRLQNLQRAVTPNVAVVYGLADGSLYVLSQTQGLLKLVKA